MTTNGEGQNWETTSNNRLAAALWTILNLFDGKKWRRKKESHIFLYFSKSLFLNHLTSKGIYIYLIEENKCFRDLKFFLDFCNKNIYEYVRMKSYSHSCL